MHQTAMLLIDAFEPEGITELAKDSIFMMPHLGVLSSVHEHAAMEVFERDCLVYLGTCVAAKGVGKPGKNCFSWSLDGGARGSGDLAFGEVELVELGPDETAELEVKPARGFDLGAGSGKVVKRTIRGGTVGVILDARGRSLALPEDRAGCREAVSNVIDRIGSYPAGVTGVVQESGA